jgi:aspartyl-tRNA(Asn)/glutamyl-tRNA(Gln) amidotransferase subunit A
VSSPRGRGVGEEAFATTVRAQAQEDLTEATLSESMTMLRSGTVRPTDFVNAHVDRIERFDRFYQAFAARPSREDLLAQA